MRYRITQLKIEPRAVAADGGGVSKEKLLGEIERAIEKSLKRGLKGGAYINNVEIVRESIDARRKPEVKLVYTVDFDCEDECAGKNIELIKESRHRYEIPKVDVREEASRPLVVGFGPCGIFAALILAEAGLRPLVLERGKCLEERVADVESFFERGADPNPESNVQFGEGGAGTFSDGKLTTGIKDARIRKVLESFVEAGAEPSILYKHKPHIGTDKLREVIVNLRQRIEELGGEIRFGSRLEGIEISRGKLFAVRVSKSEDGEKPYYIEAKRLILAMGHSARDTFGMLYDAGFEMKQKAFSIGLRIEHPQKMIDEVQYGDASLSNILGAADYKLSYKCKDADKRGVYTFCMCPGGQVVNASTEPETAVTNGMSNSAREGEFANSALLVDVRTSDFEPEHPLAGIEFQKKYEKLAWKNYKVTRGSKPKNEGIGLPTATYAEFRDDANNVLRRSLPDFAVASVLEAMPNLARKLKGFDRDDAKMTGIESRSSSPVRIARDENMEALINGEAINGVIPAGEGPGYAGGIMSAAVDGIKAAEALIKSL